MTADRGRVERRRVITPEDIGKRGATIDIRMTAREKVRLARRLGLLTLDALAATLRFEVADRENGLIRVSATIEARIVQRCVVTLDPVPRTIRDSFSVLYAPALADRPEREIEVPIDGEAPEPLPDEGIDAGELVAEHLALVLDPYPRHPDAPPGPFAYATEAAEEESPFAALGRMKSTL